MKYLVDRLNGRLSRPARVSNQPTADNSAPAPAPAPAATSDGGRDGEVAPVTTEVFPDHEYDGPDYDESGSIKANYGSPSATEDEGEEEEEEDTGHSRCVLTDKSSPCTVDTHGALALESPSSLRLIASTSGAVKLTHTIVQLRIIVLLLQTGVRPGLWRRCQRG